MHIQCHVTDSKFITIVGMNLLRRLERNLHDLYANANKLTSRIFVLT